MWIAFSIELRELHTYILVCAAVQIQFLLEFSLPKGPWLYTNALCIRCKIFYRTLVSQFFAKVLEAF